MQPQTAGGLVGITVYFVATYIGMSLVKLHATAPGDALPILAFGVLLLAVGAGKATSYFLRLARKNREDQQRHREDQQHLALRLSNLLAGAKTSAASLPELIKSGETSLDVAEREFEEGTFAPFWDAVEHAANALAEVSARISGIISNSSQYSTGTTQLDTPIPPFELGIRTLPDPSHTAKRMRAIVRRAQKDFHFATIYEQRKTNLILVAGFSSLGQAINDLGDTLATSMDSLGEVVATEFRITREQAAQESEARREHESQELAILDNIQRRKKSPRRPRR